MSCSIADMAMLYRIRPSVITLAMKVLPGAADVIISVRVVGCMVVILAFDIISDYHIDLIACKGQQGPWCLQNDAVMLKNEQSGAYCVCNMPRTVLLLLGRREASMT